MLTNAIIVGFSFFAGVFLAAFLWIVDWKEPDRPGLISSMLVVGSALALCSIIAIWLTS